MLIHNPSNCIIDTNFEKNHILLGSVETKEFTADCGKWLMGVYGFLTEPKEAEPKEPTEPKTKKSITK